MKKLKLLLLTSVVTLSACHSAPANNPAQITPPVKALPPAYLAVYHWKHCLADQKVTDGSSQQWCLPSSKPKNCPQKSWDTLSKDNSLSACKS